MSNKIVFNREQTFQLIKEVNQRPCLWNPYDDEYSKRNPVAKAWVDISKCMDNVSVMFLRSKWKCLRDTYKKELNKHPDAYHGSWRYFKRLQFLIFKTNGPEETNVSDNDGSEKDTDESNDASELPLIKSETTVQYEEPIPEKKRKSNEEEFDVLFLHSLTPYFKQLDPIRKLVVRSKMQDMLFNEIAAQNSGSGPRYD